MTLLSMSEDLECSTIKTRMIIIVTAVLVTLSVSLCGMSYYYINHLETEQALDNLNRTCGDLVKD